MIRLTKLYGYGGEKMIERIHGKLVPICDVCGDELEEFDSFDDARDAMVEEEWTTSRVGDVWVNACKKCGASISYA